MLHNSQHVFISPFGPLTITTNNNCLCSILLMPKNKLTKEIKQFSPLQQNINQQLQQYFQNPHHKFTLPFDLIGTAFQKKVWQALAAIPVGTTKTYGDLAKKLKTGARAIGNGCRQNPIPLIIPCHRVVAANSLGGFSGKRDGAALAIKQWLLKHEQHIQITNQKHIFD